MQGFLFLEERSASPGPSWLFRLGLTGPCLLWWNSGPQPGAGSPSPVTGELVTTWTAGSPPELPIQKEGSGLRLCISDKLLDDTHATGPRITQSWGPFCQFAPSSLGSLPSSVWPQRSLLGDQCSVPCIILALARLKMFLYSFLPSPLSLLIISPAWKRLSQGHTAGEGRATTGNLYFPVPGPLHQSLSGESGLCLELGPRL